MGFWKHAMVGTTLAAALSFGGFIGVSYADTAKNEPPPVVTSFCFSK